MARLEAGPWPRAVSPCGLRAMGHWLVVVGRWPLGCGPAGKGLADAPPPAPAQEAHNPQRLPSVAQAGPAHSCVRPTPTTTPAGPVTRFLFAAAYQWKLRWLKAGWSSATASPLFDRLVFGKVGPPFFSHGG